LVDTGCAPAVSIATTLVDVSRTVVSTPPALASVSDTTAESTSAADESGLSNTSNRSFGVLLGASLWTIHAPHAIDTKAAMPTPFHIQGPIGARSGLVPHHRHDPAVAG
jgi:hypothetical protein